MQGICCECQNLVPVEHRGMCLLVANHDFAVRDPNGSMREYKIRCEGSNLLPQCLVAE
jgi:hypothetical protein